MHLSIVMSDFFTVGLGSVGLLKTPRLSTAKTNTTFNYFEMFGWVFRFWNHLESSLTISRSFKRSLEILNLINQLMSFKGGLNIWRADFGCVKKPFALRTRDSFSVRNPFYDWFSTPWDIDYARSERSERSATLFPTARARRFNNGVQNSAFFSIFFFPLAATHTISSLSSAGLHLTVTTKCCEKSNHTVLANSCTWIGHF